MSDTSKDISLGVQDLRTPAPSVPKGNSKSEIVLLKIFSLKQ